MQYEFICRKRNPSIEPTENTKKKQPDFLNVSKKKIRRTSKNDITCTCIYMNNMFSKI